MVTSENKITKQPFWQYFRKSWNNIFKSCKIILYLHLLLLKRIIHITMCVTQNSWKIFPCSQISTFFKNSLWNTKFSYIFRLSPLCMSVEKWRKSWSIKLLLRFILEHCVHSEIGMAYLFTVSSKNNLMLTNNGPQKVLNFFEKQETWKLEKWKGYRKTNDKNIADNAKCTKKLFFLNKKHIKWKN